MAWIRLLLIPFLIVLSGRAEAADEAGAAEASTSAVDAPPRGSEKVSPEVAREAAAIARQTMSPFCPGRTLADCPSEYATAWRKDIRAMVASGMSAPDIQRELERRAGSNLSGSPNRDAGWSVPVGLSLGAALLLVFVLSQLRRPEAGPPASQADEDSEEKRRERQSVAKAEGEPPEQGDLGEVVRSSKSGADHEPPHRVAVTAVDDARVDEELDRI